MRVIFMNKRNKKLYILGNGFDLHHCLPTRLQDFQEIIQNIDTGGMYENNNVYWTDFEEDLSNIDVDSLLENYGMSPDHSSEREMDREGVISQLKGTLDEMISIKIKTLHCMVEEAEKKLETLTKMNNFNFEEEDEIISFNYTETPRKLYDADNVCYIHGKYLEDELVFGFKHESEEYGQTEVSKIVRRDYEEDYKDIIRKIDNDKTLDEESKAEFKGEAKELYQEKIGDYYSINQKEIINDFYEGNKKCYQYTEFESYLYNINNNEIFDIYILGHQMGEIDSEYFEIIEKVLTTKNWYITQFFGEPAKMDLGERFKFNHKFKYTTIENTLI